MKWSSASRSPTRAAPNTHCRRACSASRWWHPARYRLEVVPPANYNFPSQRTIADLQTLPNAPFRLQPGSFGQNFVVTAAPAVAVDVPLDASNSVLVLRKTAGQQIATTGDFVQYTLTLENTSEDGPVTLVDVVDRLPAGARFRAGSLRLNGTRIADPVLAADGSFVHLPAAAAGAPGKASRCATWSSSPSRCAA